MTKLIKFSLATILLPLSLMSHSANYEDLSKTPEPYFEFTFYAKAYHFFQDDLNGNNNFIGLTYRNYKYGASVSSFKNSFYRQSYMASISKYFHPRNNVETFFSLGVVSGYRESLILMPFVGVSYTKYDNFTPTISIFGSAAVVSFSTKF